MNCDGGIKVIRHPNRIRRSKKPKSWQDCTSRPRHDDRNTRAKKRDKRLTDRRVSAIQLQNRVGRHTAKTMMLEAA